jgi:hypothetical protein
LPQDALDRPPLGQNASFPERGHPRGTRLLVRKLPQATEQPVLRLRKVPGLEGAFLIRLIVVERGESRVLGDRPLGPQSLLARAAGDAALLGVDLP